MMRQPMIIWAFSCNLKQGFRQVVPWLGKTIFRPKVNQCNPTHRGVNAKNPPLDEEVTGVLLVVAVRKRQQTHIPISPDRDLSPYGRGVFGRVDVIDRANAAASCRLLTPSLR